jgi:hypothetical protein
MISAKSATIIVVDNSNPHLATGLNVDNINTKNPVASETEVIVIGFPVLFMTLRIASE